MRHLLYLLIFLMTAGWSLTTKATHIVGGDLTYRCLGNNTYEITVTIYQDCFGGDPNAIAQDNPAFISVFDGKTNFRYFWDSIGIDSKQMVPPNFNNACVKNPPQTCLTKATFTKNYQLPKENVNGFRIVYQRCCRNGSIVNIVNPGGVGATYSCMIPPADVAACNNSAVYKNYPPQIICVNNPLIYDHGAIDPDGDSLSYEFCEAYVGGDPSNAKPIPELVNPWDTVQYATYYNSKRPMTGNPSIQIDAHTGLITGTPNMQGRYVVTVCCHEWRNKILINTVHREFQFVVTNCSKAVVADIPQLSSDFNTYIVECKSKTVFFRNNSSGGFAYSWKFGIPGSTSDTSSEFEPTFTYPDTGVYNVTLVVNRGTTCPDSITRFVKIFPSFKADFISSGNFCPNSPIQFNDQSQATFKPVLTWQWDFGDTSGTSTQNDPVYTYAKGGVYNVKLISKSIKGCIDTMVKPVEIENFHAGLSNGDTIIVKGEHINFNATGGVTYAWSPPTCLSDTGVCNPIGYYPDTGIYNYMVHIKSSFGCEGNANIRVWVVDKPSIFVPSAFSPNGDGLNDILKPIGIGYRNVNFFRVFNRWGQQLYYSNRFKIGWDGSSNGGAAADVGVYFWELSVTDRFGNEQLVKGDVTLIR